MPTVEVSFSALPAHVRTARLIALAVARRAGVDEGVLDEVRLAVGEACSRAVGINQSAGNGSAGASPVVMRLIDEQGRFTVEVVDTGSAGDAVVEPDLGDLDPDELAAPTEDPLPDLPPGFGLAVISGLVEDVSVGSDTDGTHVRMTWPAVDIMAPDLG
jgi:anti-sigma regulatory factor (Ser/Thr protein kinase)